MKTITSSNGYKILIDDCDYEKVSQYKWFVRDFGHTCYALSTTKINGKNVLLHRFVMGDDNHKIIDHINSSGLDNRRCNLRFCNSSQNNWNRKSTGLSSKFKGVSWHSGDKRWQCRIQKNYKTIWIGIFKDEIKAAIAYDKASISLFGEYARTNFPKTAYA